MALIMCPECGKEFSSLAKCCPNCACPTEAILRMTGGDGGSAPEAVDPGLEFTPSTGGRSYSVRKYKGKSRDLVIPSTYNGKPVTEIGNEAFKDNSALTSVTIPDSVTNIGYEAFSHCSGLTSVTIGAGVTNIGSFAFSCCRGLTSVTIPNSVMSIGRYAFQFCSGLTSVTIGNSVKKIGDFAFSGCSGLTSVTIPNSVTSIGWGAFYDCSGLTSVTIPSSVTSIGDWAFKDCTALTVITFQGTEEEWNAIEKEDDWDENLGNGSYHIRFAAEARKGFDDFDF